MLKDELVGNTSLAEQKSLAATQEKEESLRLLEEGQEVWEDYKDAVR